MKLLSACCALPNVFGVSTSQHSGCETKVDAQLGAHSATSKGGGEEERDDGPGEDSAEDDSGVEKETL